MFNNELIDKIPLEQRLVFAAKERRTHILFHQSVVEKILEIEPKGLTVYRLSKYDPDQPFIEEYMAKKKSR